LILAASLVAAACVAARGQSASPSPGASPSARPQGQSPEASPELAEATRLSREVVRLYAAGKFEGALPLAERALSLLEAKLGPQHPLVADAVVNVAATLNELKQVERARQAYERAVTLFEANFGPDAEKTVNTREMLGWLYYRKRDYGKAEAALKSALAGREKSVGVESPQLLNSLTGLAAVYLATGEASKREAAYTRLLDVADKFQGKMPEMVGRILELYICTGATHVRASGEQAAVYKRITGRVEPQETGGIQGEVLSGKAISKPAPSYPLKAKESRVQGTVVVRITVDETGRVVNAAPVCGPALLHDAAVIAARDARFTSTLLDGRPVKVTGTITYNFVLQ
jgi:TonB family protein